MKTIPGLIADVADYKTRLNEFPSPESIIDGPEPEKSPYWSLKKELAATLYALGDQYEASNQYSEAVKAYYEAFELTGLTKAFEKLNLFLGDEILDPNPFTETNADAQSLNLPGATAEELFYKGLQYQAGLGEAKCLAKAVACYSAAAQPGHVAAQIRLGITLLYSGDQDNALMWFEKAANSGEDRSCLARLWLFRYHFHKLNYDYESSNNVAGYKLGYENLLIAARGGNAIAQFLIGDLFIDELPQFLVDFLSAQRIERGPRHALFWYLIAEAQVKSPEIHFKIGNAHAQLKDQVKAVQHWCRAVCGKYVGSGWRGIDTIEDELNDELDNIFDGWIDATVNGSQEDQQKARENISATILTFQRYVEIVDSPLLSRFLGQIYENGLGVEVNPAEALNELNDELDNIFDGWIDDTVNGSPEDQQKARENISATILTFQRYVEIADSPLLSCFLGQIYESGLGVEVNPAEALKWYEANQYPDWRGLARLADIYEQGLLGVERNIEKALKLWRKIHEDLRQCGERDTESDLARLYSLPDAPSAPSDAFGYRQHAYEFIRPYKLAAITALHRCVTNNPHDFECAYHFALTCMTIDLPSFYDHPFKLSNYSKFLVLFKAQPEKVLQTLKSDELITLEDKIKYLTMILQREKTDSDNALRETLVKLHQKLAEQHEAQSKENREKASKYHSEMEANKKVRKAELVESAAAGGSSFFTSTPNKRSRVMVGTSSSGDDDIDVNDKLDRDTGPADRDDDDSDKVVNGAGPT